MKRLILLAAALAVAGCQSAGRRAVEEVLAVERDFAAQADRDGIVPAFKRHVEPTAVLFLPGPVVIKPRLEGATWPGDLNWRPEVLGASAAGDVVFSAGPSAWKIGDNTDHGIYLTIWRKGSDGRWRFPVDRGTPMAADLYSGPVKSPAVIVSDRSFAKEVDFEDARARFENDAAGDYGAALERWLAPQAWVLRPNLRPVAGIPAGEGWSEVDFELHKQDRSADGTLVWSYGAVTWRKDGEVRSGWYVHVWQRVGGRWRLTMDSVAS